MPINLIFGTLIDEDMKAFLHFQIPRDVLVLARKGAPKLNKPSIRGDHLFFRVKVTIPKRIGLWVFFKYIFVCSLPHYFSVN
ncbi:hypothetical protein JHK82_035731 [Glycine max]|uniref:Uncharacterized protein n=1 Tax=Glycine max TaxID=3847 RepID=A0A0R0GX00_SOYBN|nr:hypothetical protein JHK85_036458 [Glycine max]KAG4976389.1 hypothetical protein JHK86_035863 [Glycine max]KAG5112462.1 hypothetical protein JHK82_035731 [Glycine max]KAG5129738.1 hypothetical protein JHK84_036135 [Glycine max]KAH1100514.1 hypothetical protein GYH30_035593 [Glycine max]